MGQLNGAIIRNSKLFFFLNWFGIQFKLIGRVPELDYVDGDLYEVSGIIGDNSF